MRTQTFLDEPASPSSRPQRKALEPLDVIVVEEHIANCNDALVDFVRMTGKNDALGDDTVERWWERGASGD